MSSRYSPEYEQKAAAVAGLGGVIAGDSKICDVDGEKGELVYWGYNIHDLVNASFEEVVYLLWNGELPTRTQLQAFRETLRPNVALCEPLRNLLPRFPKDASPMAMLRTAVSALGMYDTTSLLKQDPKENQKRAQVLLGQTSSIVTGFERLRRGLDFISPLQELGFAQNFLFMLTGKKPDALASQAFDVALVLHADHEFNASTFAARVTAATLADIYSAVTSAIGALQGPLHGGANEQVMKMLLEIKEVKNTEAVLASRLAQKRKIPGFGHRVYRAEDPRATHLRKMAKELGEKLGNTAWWEILMKAEAFMWREKKIYANVDCYSAAVYNLLGIPTDLFTPIFAVSRMAGWTAHVLEQYSDNKLIRPRAQYIGPPRRAFVPLNER